MGLQTQLNDLSSGSIPLLLLAHIAACINHLRSFVLALFQSLGLSRFDPDPVADDGFFAAVGSGLAGLIMLSDQLTLNNQLFYRYNVVDDDDSSKCVVCQSTFRDGDHVRMLPCRHVFHRRCLDGWLHHYKFNCPLCRTPLISDERVTLTERRVGCELES